MTRTSSTSSSSSQSLERHSQVTSPHPKRGTLASLAHEQTSGDDCCHLPPPPPPLGDSSDVDVEAPASAAAAIPAAPAGGDVVFILDLPADFTVGCDATALTARHFVGFRDVPDGPHFFWVAHPGGMAPRSGFWIVTRDDDDDASVHAVRWDRDTELLVDAPSDAIPRDAATLLLSYRDLTPRSGSEAQAAALIWGQLTSCITGDLLTRVTGQQSGRVWHLNTMDQVRGAVAPSAERAMEQHLAAMRRAAAPPPPPRELRFALDQHAKTYSAALFGADRTREATDATSYLTSLLDSDSDSGVGASRLVGELQLALLAAAHLGSEACLAQWWHVVQRLLLRAYDLPRRRPALAAAWLRALTAQLAYGGTWLDPPLAELLSEARVRELRLALIVYRRRLEEMRTTTTTPEEGEVVAAFARLEAAVAEDDAFGWDIAAEYVRKGTVVMEDGEEVELEMQELQAEDERGEWAPEIVELDEHGREKGLVSWND
ncbi:AAR2 family protein [Cordyceps militaris CM01]|uniref:AAR2 family protein n=1 Tax=Cordyceps militaris (strain CM01) TaxID=983644 RepID=G3JUB0_CORMM|nr:AAR2 family protein [Cordyceps militaris CM01]EGX87817.1 AAR2 family protein [Cordyceps militaris CM01]